MAAKTIMIQGTSSDVGKSVIVTALCRIFYKKGFKTAPFKAQNMSLNSYPTRNGEEIGIAQAVQAEAAGAEMCADMNPILLKPTSNSGSQVIIKGKPIGTMGAREYMKEKDRFFNIVSTSLRSLEKVYDIVVIEGAGSPAEINLYKYDIVNMRIAHLASAPVILVGDIDRGGVFASLIGTLELLKDDDRKKIKGFIINKFRGDYRLLKEGLTMLKERTGIEVIGVLPHLDKISIKAEDSLSIKSLSKRSYAAVKIAVIRLPMMSNFTDFEPLAEEQGIELYYTDIPEDIDSADIIIIPGTKNTINDLIHLKSTGFFQHIHLSMRKGTSIIGICGGYQMLGKYILDKDRVESDLCKVEGLAIFDMSTTFCPSKITEQVEAVALDSNTSVKGYEIHMGNSKVNYSKCTPMFNIIKRGGGKVNILEGCRLKDGMVWGTYIHGLFHNEKFRIDFLNRIRKKKGIAPAAAGNIMQKANAYDRLAEQFQKYVDMDTVFSIINGVV